MKTLLTIFNQICKNKYKEFGFKYYKKAFYRVKGDVIQSFSLKKMHGVPVCTVEFGVFPLCLPAPVYLDAGVYELHNFCIERCVRDSGWRFNPEDGKSIEICVYSIINSIDNNLMPFFARCVDTSSTFLQMMNLEKLFDSNRQEVLKIMGEVDKARPLGERMLCDYRKYYMALKVHEFSFAEEFLKFQINLLRTKLGSFCGPDAIDQPEIVKQRCLAQLQRCSDELKRLEAGDILYFDNLVRENELQMRNYLTMNYPQICI